LSTVENPSFLRIQPTFGLGSIVPTEDRQDADYFILEGVGRQPITDYDSLVKEALVNRKFIEGYKAKLAVLRERISSINMDLENT